MIKFELLFKFDLATDADNYLENNKKEITEAI